MVGLQVAVPFTSFAQPSIPIGQVDFFMGVDFNYRDILWRRIYDILINLTPGVKWNMSKGWQLSAQALVPVYNDYGERYKKVRLNMAVLSKEVHLDDRLFLKASGGCFSDERYGLDLKVMYIVSPWLALEAQTGITGYCSMAAGWEASTPERWTGLLGTDFYIRPFNTEIRVRGGKFVYSDYGGRIEAMRHFKHCTVGVYGEYSNKGKENAGFKIIAMIPPYKRKRHKINFRPASNFRLTYSVEGDAYANCMYNTDPEENEREGWFNQSQFKWGRNCTQLDFKEKSSQIQKKEDEK